MRQSEGIQIIAVIAWLNLSGMIWYSIGHPEKNIIGYVIAWMIFSLIMLSLVYTPKR